MSVTIWTLICFLSCISLCSAFTSYTKHVSNYVSLVSAYEQDAHSVTDVPPLIDVDKTVEVNVDISLYAINGFDEVAGNIELVAALNMTWQDEISSIRSVNFQFTSTGRKSFLIPYDLIWTPKLILTNAIGDASEVGDVAYLCRFNMETSMVIWRPRVVISGSCTPDVTYYPFDKQSCEFIYTAWGFQSDEIMLTTSSDKWDTADYGLSGEWDIVTTSTDTYTQSSQSFIRFKLTILRKPLYFAFNILLPVLVLCLLNSTVFLLPAESGERVGFSVTCFLSFVVLLNMIMDIMPRSSSPISFLCYYLVVMMANSGAMTLVTILIMRIYHKPEKSKVPRSIQWMSTFINCGCARLRCFVLCFRLIRKTCSCKDKRCCGCKGKSTSASQETLTQVSTASNDITTDAYERPIQGTVSCDKLNAEGTRKNGLFRCIGSFKGGSKTIQEDEGRDTNQEEETTTDSSGFFINSKVQKLNVPDNDSDITDESYNGVEKKSEIKDTTVDLISDNVEHSNCFGFFKKAKITIDENEDIETELYEATMNRFNESGVQKRKFIGKEDSDTNTTVIARWENATHELTGKKANTLASIKLEDNESNNNMAHKKEEHRIQINDEKTNIDPKQNESNRKVSDIVINKDVREPSIKSNQEDKRDDRRLSSSTDAVNTEVRRPSIKSVGEIKMIRKQSTQKEGATTDVRRPSIKSGSEIKSAGKQSTLGEGEKTDVRRSSIPSKKNTDCLEEDSVESDDEDVDSLADLEEEVEWPEVGRILDTFFFLGFLASEIFFTIVFLVPIFTGGE